MAWNSSAMRSPLSVTVFSPSTYTGATGISPVPGTLMPMLACLLSPGPFTTQPITATVMASTPGCSLRHTGFWCCWLFWLLCVCCCFLVLLVWLLLGLVFFVGVFVRCLLLCWFS